MKACSQKPDVIQLNKSIRFLKEEDVKMIRASLVDGSFRGNAVTLLELIKFHRRDLPALRALRSELKQANIQQNPFTFNSLIDAFGKKGDLDAVRELGQEMKQANLQPDQVTFN